MFIKTKHLDDMVEGGGGIFFGNSKNKFYFFVKVIFSLFLP